MLKIIMDEEQKQELTFGQVKENQLFVNFYGNLCQKCDIASYNIIAFGTNGHLHAGQCMGIPENATVKRVFPLSIRFYWDFLEDK